MSTAASSNEATKLWLDAAACHSDLSQAMGEQLQERIVGEVFPRLVRRILTDRRQQFAQPPTEAELHAVFAAAVQQLFRMLSRLYGEGRGLLPAHPDDELEETALQAGIDYRLLEVRLLGSIYEALLEFELRVAEQDVVVKQRGRTPIIPLPRTEQCKPLGESALCQGDAYLAHNKAARKASGSYYTPQPIVAYIVEQTIGPVLGERLAALRSEFETASPTCDNEAHEELVARFFAFRALDPAMGAGHFLVAAVDLITDRMAAFLSQFPLNPVSRALEHSRQTMVNAWQKRSIASDPDRWTSVEWLKQHVLKHCIYGVDLDPLAVEIARLSLWLDAACPGMPLESVARNLRCGNALVGRRSAEEEDRESIDVPTANAADWHDFHWDEEFPTVFQRHGEARGGPSGFDAIVGNPPYVSFGLRGAGQLDARLRSYYVARYPASARYKIATYALFIERAYALLRPNGAVGFVVPDSFLLGKYFEGLRRDVLRQGAAVRELLLFQESCWEQGEAGCPVILIGPQRDARANVELGLFESLAELAAEQRLGKRRRFAVPNAVYRDTPRSRFYFFTSDEELAVYQRVVGDSIPLCRVVKFYSGLIGKRGRASIVFDERAAQAAGSRISKLIDSGSQLRPFRVAWNGKYIVHEAALYKSGYTPRYYERPKLFLNQTGDAPKACVDAEGYYCLNNMHVGYPVAGDAALYLVAGILNSRFGRAFYRFLSRENGRALAQLDVDVLDLFPLPANAESFAADAERPASGAIDLLERIATLSLTLHEPNGHSDGTANDADACELLDQAVLDAYDLTAAEFEAMAARS